MGRKATPIVQGETSEERVAHFRQTNATFFWQPYPWQQRALDKIRANNTTAVVASNKIGKTCLDGNILASWVCGYEPWTMANEPGGDDWIQKGPRWFRRSSLGIDPPVNLIMTGEDWKLHIGRTLVPEIIKWMPISWYSSPKKNEQGIDYFWEFFNKSTLTIMSYSQDDDLFESFRAQGVIMDEPPPKSKYSAMSRGLLLDCGKTLLSLTPLKEAWILDDIVLSNRRDIGVVDGLKITDNPDLYNSDLATLGEMGLTDPQKQKFFDLLLYDDAVKKTYVTDKGFRAERYLEDNTEMAVQAGISKLKILKFIKDIDPTDVPARVFGEFKALVGRVLKEFDDNVHIIKPFEVPTDWPVVAMIDFHLSKPQAISYWTVNKQDIHFCIGERWENMDGGQIADDIIRKQKAGWMIEEAYIDPLSKGDLGYIKNRMGEEQRDTFSIIEEKLADHDITLMVASKDKTSGIKNLQTMLKGVSGMATLYVFDTCERFLYEVKRWVFDEEGKPAKDVSDHFMENAYRYTLVGNSYGRNKVTPLQHSNRPASDSSWMAM